MARSSSIQVLGAFRMDVVTRCAFEKRHHETAAKMAAGMDIEAYNGDTVNHQHKDCNDRYDGFSLHFPKRHILELCARCRFRFSCFNFTHLSPHGSMLDTSPPRDKQKLGITPEWDSQRYVIF